MGNIKSRETNSRPGFVQRCCQCFEQQPNNPQPQEQNEIMDNQSYQFQQQELIQIQQMEHQTRKSQEQHTSNLQNITKKNKIEFNQKQIITSKNLVQKSEYLNLSLQIQKSFQQSFKDLNNHQLIKKGKTEYDIISLEEQNRMSQNKNNFKTQDQEVEQLKQKLKLKKLLIEQLTKENQALKMEIDGLKYFQTALQESELIKFTQEDEQIIKDILVEEIQSNFDCNQLLKKIYQNMKFSQLQNKVIVKNIEILEYQFNCYRNQILQEFTSKSQELETLILSSFVKILKENQKISTTDLYVQYQRLTTFFKKKQNFRESFFKTSQNERFMEGTQDEMKVLPLKPLQGISSTIDCTQEMNKQVYEDLLEQNVEVKQENEKQSQVNKKMTLKQFDLKDSKIQNSSFSINKEKSREGKSLHSQHKVFQVLPIDKLSESQNLTNSMRSIITQQCIRCQCLINGPTLQTNCQHCYHQECFDEMLEEQIIFQKMTEIKCLCKQKLDNKILVQVSSSKQESLKNQIYQNQLNVIKLQSQIQKQIVQCQNCNFFWINLNGKQVKQLKCFQCQK